MAVAVNVSNTHLVDGLVADRVQNRWRVRRLHDMDFIVSESDSRPSLTTTSNV